MSYKGCDNIWLLIEILNDNYFLVKQIRFLN